MPFQGECFIACEWFPLCTNAFAILSFPIGKGELLPPPTDSQGAGCMNSVGSREGTRQRHFNLILPLKSISCTYARERTPCHSKVKQMLLYIYTFKEEIYGIMWCVGNVTYLGMLSLFYISVFAADAEPIAFCFWCCCCCWTRGKIRSQILRIRHSQQFYSSNTSPLISLFSYMVTQVRQRDLRTEM